MSIPREVWSDDRMWPSCSNGLELHRKTKQFSQKWTTIAGLKKDDEVQSTGNADDGFNFEVRFGGTQLKLQPTPVERVENAENEQLRNSAMRLVDEEDSEDEDAEEKFTT